MSALPAKSHEFTPSERARSGRASRPVEERYFRIMRAACDFDKFKRIVEKTTELALAGDLIATKLLFDRLLPAKRIEEMALAAGGSINVLVVQGEELARRREALREVVVS